MIGLEHRHNDKNRDEIEFRFWHQGKEISCQLRVVYNLKHEFKFQEFWFFNNGNKRDTSMFTKLVDRYAEPISMIVAWILFHYGLEESNMRQLRLDLTTRQLNGVDADYRNEIKCNILVRKKLMQSKMYQNIGALGLVMQLCDQDLCINTAVRTPRVSQTIKLLNQGPRAAALPSDCLPMAPPKRKSEVDGKTNVEAQQLSGTVTTSKVRRIHIPEDEDEPDEALPATSKDVPSVTDKDLSPIAAAPSNAVEVNISERTKTYELPTFILSIDI